MNTPQILVAAADNTAFLKPVGNANFQAGAHGQTALAELDRRGFRRLVVDLSACDRMDSTFLGLLASTALRWNRERGQGQEPAVELWRPSPLILELLDDLGVRSLFQITEISRPAPEYQPASAGEVSRAILSQASLAAHETLMSLNPANALKFKDVVAFLKEEAGPSSPCPTEKP